MRSAKLKYNILHYILPLVFMVVFAGLGEVKGQTSKIYAEYIGPAPLNTGGNAGAGGTAGGLGSVGAVGTFSIVNPTNINDAVYTNYVELRAQSGKNGSGLGGGDGGASSAYINLNFTGSITPKAGTLITIKLQAPTISRVQIQACIDGTPVGSPQFVSTLGVSAADEYAYVPTVDCNSIRITTNTGLGTALGGVSTNDAYVYYAYMLDPKCNPPNYTATRKTAVLDLGSTITNPANAIDGDLNSFSFFSNGLGVGTTLYQNVYFSQPSPAGSVATLTLSIPPAALSAGVLGYININTYNGTTLVSNTAFSGLLLGTDLLTLLNSGGKTTISISTPSAFDRIELAASSLVSLATSINLYEVQITPAKPTFSTPALQNVSSCSGNQVTLTPNAPGAGNELRWYSSLTATAPFYTGNTYSPSPTATTTYYVATAKTNCTAESERVPVTVTVNPLPAAPTVPGTAICSGATAVLSVTNPDANYTYKWYTASSGGASFYTGSSYTSTALTANTDYYVETTITATGCTSSTRSKTTVTIKPIPTLSSLQTLADICNNTAVSYTPLSATSGTTFTWTRAAVAGISNAAVTTGITGAINETLINTTPSSIAVTYVYTLLADGCPNTQNVTVTVKPTPKLSSLQSLPSICTTAAVNYIPASLTAGTTFTWTRAAVTGISNAAVVIPVNGPVNETLVNTTINPLTVTYVYTLSANGCSNTQNVSITIYPKFSKPHISLQ